MIIKTQKSHTQGTSEIILLIGKKKPQIWNIFQSKIGRGIKKNRLEILQLHCIQDIRSGGYK